MSFAIGLATRRDEPELLARRKKGEKGGPINVPTVTERNHNGNLNFGCGLDNGVPVTKCKCGSLFQTERGLKIHMAKLKCEGEVEKQRSDAAVHSGKTPNDTGPDSHHSSECVRVSGLTIA